MSGQDFSDLAQAIGVEVDDGMSSATKERPVLFSAPMVRAILAGKKTQTRRAVKPQPYALKRLGFDGGLIPYRLGKEVPDMPGIFIQEPIKFPYGQPGDRLWVRESSMFRSECGKYLCRQAGNCGGAFDAWTVDGKTHWKWDRREPLSDYPLELNVGSYSCERGDQKKGSFTLGLYRCNPRKKVKAFTGNTVIEHQDVVFRRRLPAILMPRWASRLTLEIKTVRVERLHDITAEDAIAEGALPTAETDPGKLSRSEWEQCKSTALACFQLLWRKINGDESWDSNPWVWVVGFEQITSVLPRQ